MIGPQITTASGLNFSGLKYATHLSIVQKTLKVPCIDAIPEEK